MKSIAFLRKAWKKWAPHHRDEEQANDHRSQVEPQKSASPLSTCISPTSSHTLPAKSRVSRHMSLRQFGLHTACSAPDSPISSQSPPSSSTLPLQKLTPSCTLFPKDFELYQKKSQFPVLQEQDVSDDPGSTRPYNSANHARSTDTILSTASTASSDEVQYPQKSFDRLDAKPRHTLCHRARSVPYLPYEDEINPTQASSVDPSEGIFPLSLFPTPPALIARKSIPPPLMLHTNSTPTSLQSSCDSTPVGTPTTPRFLPPHSPSKLSFGSCKRFHSGRRVTSISPPPFNPPNSPLPSPPICHENNGPPLEGAGRPRIRTAYSSSNLKDTLPFSATHRLTSSESISDQSSLPIKKSEKPRPEGMDSHHLQASSEATEKSTLTAVENNVQWGYAF